jgi:S-DNA-T family DNA segregation ATPase FtsK/SpoIIIE
VPKRKYKSKKSTTNRKTKKGSFWKSFFNFITSPFGRTLILIIIIAALLYWFLPDITRWSTATWNSTLNLLGAGLVLIAITLMILILILLNERAYIFVKYWHQCLGFVAIFFVIWGILALIDPNLGGTFGQGIAGPSMASGLLKLCGLTVLAIILIAPRWTWKILEGISRLVWGSSAKDKQPRTKPVPSTIQYQRYDREEEIAPEIVQEVTQEPVLPTESTQVKPPELKPSEMVASETWEPGKYQPSLTVGGWQIPPISILDKPVETDIVQPDVEKRAKLIEESLASYGVDTKVVQINVGPTVTQFGIEPGWDRKYKEIKERDKDGNTKIRSEEVSRTRVKVERINSLSNDLALALAAPSIRIEAPIPGKAMVGIEVPNTTFGSVNLRSIIESSAFQKISAKSKLAIALGKGAGGETHAADLAKMPHLLIAGATGSGKSVYINSVICCLLANNTPDDLRFIMIDPKRVELVTFDGLPHLISPVVVDIDKAVLGLRWLTQEMDGRYRKFAKAGARNIDSYNKSCPPGQGLPYIVLIIDELADLMMVSFDEVEHTLCRLAQLSRATGIHLIVATQRPSVDVVTGLIKANFPTRISFALTSQVDSRTILDSAGADKLLGRGDMLYMSTDASKARRLQGPFLTDAEIDRLVNFWRNQRIPDETPVIFEDVVSAEPTEKDTEDPLLEAARQLVADHEGISTSFLQRRLRIGYPRAARLTDQLKEEGALLKDDDN